MAVVMQPNAYEAERQNRIRENQQRLAALGVLQQRTLFDGAFRVVKDPTKRPGPRKVKGTPPSRCSPRLSSGPAEFKGLSAEQGAAIERKALAVASGKLLASSRQPVKKPTSGASCSRPVVPLPPPPRPLTAAEAAQRCSSRARGSIYDQVAGMCCHFCRQKKLCGETDCPRCANRDPDADCIGKSECGRCGGSQGRFCRACLLVRYGQVLEEVRAPGSGWLCPHCYEAEHPEQGLICNSSICMKRRGMQPTGIAIFSAQAQGFASVAHLVADRLGRPLGPAAAGSPVAAPMRSPVLTLPGAGSLRSTQTAAEAAVASPTTTAAATTAAAAVASFGRVVRAAVAGAGRAAGSRKRAKCEDGKENVRVTRQRSGLKV